jgi:hypothetical protein
MNKEDFRKASSGKKPKKEDAEPLIRKSNTVIEKEGEVKKSELNTASNLPETEYEHSPSFD